MSGEPTRRQLNRWRRYLADERAEGAVYRELARQRTGEEREILLGIAEAESRHEEYWRARLGDDIGLPRQAGLKTRLTAWMARRFGSVFVLALLQSAESRNHYLSDEDATEQMAADEAIHAEVVRGLAARGRAKMSGDFRAAIFGANDGLVSNLALLLGMFGAGAGPATMLTAGIAGLLSGALSMAAGEYVSVTSQKELLEASTPDPNTRTAVPKLDVDRNELELVYRARGMDAESAGRKARQVFAELSRLRELGEVADGAEPGADLADGWDTGETGDAGDTGDTSGSAAVAEDGGSGLSAAVSSFLCFGVGALVPVLPLILGLAGLPAIVVACVLVGLVLLVTGALVGLLSGMSPWKRALRQLAIGAGAAAVTFTLGSLFDVAGV
ncbi:VIT1/CCC1 transporter family protein [Corynebacterium kalidii]|uniref:VIT1/CCC1 family protein n=1 Tax=Corynebacterium kalidii TaxID=2931982 RepID=A0A9X1WL63_9CORY|nr:VIT1/CCC1 family protein [Corynebacterium kalidii]MCJ7858512.1 VIT1/CCC1 family protein [Corynebacterium kalidii]